MMFLLEVLGTLLETSYWAAVVGQTLLCTGGRGMIKATWTLCLGSSHSGRADGPFQCHMLSSKAEVLYLLRKVTLAALITTVKSW